MKRTAIVCGAVAALAVWCSPAAAAGGAPQWTVTAVSTPTNLSPGVEGDKAAFDVTVTNTGEAPSDGTVTVEDLLPEGLSLDPAGAAGVELHNSGQQRDNAGAAMSCTGVRCTFGGVVIPGESLLVRFPVDVELSGEQTVTNLVHVFGGGATDVFVRTPTTISATSASFGIAPGSATSSLSSVQAGAHANLTTTVGFDTADAEGQPAGSQKETSVDLPSGFAGDLVDTPSCSVAHFSAEECPVSTQVGVATVIFPNKVLAGEAFTVPVYNLAPEPGDVAKIGFRAITALVQGDVTVRPGDYGLNTTFHNINALVRPDLVQVTIWAVPTDSSNNAWRWEGNALGKFGVSSSNARVPYLSSPTSCSGEALQTVFWSRSWEDPEGRVQATAPLGPLADCDRLALESTFTVAPTTTSAYSPTGLNVELAVNQTNENPEGLAASALKKAVVTLPEGMTINPSAGAGLEACTSQEYEAEALETSVGEGCPSDSKLGSVRIKTPALSEEATGSVFIAQPYANPYDSLIAVYVVARFPNRGVIVKVAGKVSPDPLTGALVTTFEGQAPLYGLPPVPFSTFTFAFRQGQTSPLVSPPLCGGAFQASAALTPWSDPEQLLSDIAPPFEITSGVGGGPCPAAGSPPFKPAFTAGTENNTAGTYSPFYLRIERQDGEQEITGFGVELPPGLTGNLSGIPFCSEAEIQRAREQTGTEAEASPACPAASEIGHTIAEAGVGSVLAQTPGKLYLGGPLEGAPFSVVSVTSAKVGPFDLGTVVVHLPLEINPITAQVSIPQGAADQIPHIIKGIVIHLRTIRVYVDRERFMLNPTSCAPTSLSATVVGGGADPTDPAGYDPVAVGDRFQAAECAHLAFKPTFTATTQAQTSKRGGASLHVDLTYPKEALGKDANVHQVKVELPKQLPARQETLNKACLVAVFNANSAACPAASRVGYAKAITPILPVPLVGPAYFVSYGGAQFPELVVVLQGDGVTIDLHGETFISEKTSVISSTFKTVPDQPVESFELTLPEGPYSALAANGNLCASALSMPTTFVGQNGAEIKQSTSIAVSGCKPTLSILRHRVSRDSVSVTVNAPSAGTITASGSGLVRASRKIRKAGAVSLLLHLSSHDRRLLARHKSRKLKVAVTLRFSPKHGRSISGHLSVLVG